ncbi:hypothetical protein [Thermomonospora amylolytica]|uniref:hypothetical protein n=1 Tax=Thermomonospora amylolytica TaxID=1411117 RepID=UPI000E6B51E0|nr:hypothetical protein [Thermomonospora amylolytica]
MSTLEFRYRRLLRWYPADHRRRHEEEMLGVLLAAAEPGRERPTAREAADLLGGAARIRMQRLVRLSAQDRRDAVAVAGVTAAVLLAAMSILQAAGLMGMAPTWDFALYMAPAPLSVAVLALALRGARKTAAVLAWTLFAALIGHQTYMIAAMRWEPGGEQVGLLDPILQGAPSTLLPLVTALLLSVPADPVAGRRLIGDRRLRALGLTAVLAFACEHYLDLTPLPQFYEAAAPMIFAYWAGRAMAAPAGRAAALLLAVPVAAAVPTLWPMAYSDGLTWPSTFPPVLLAPAAAVFAWTAVRALRTSPRSDREASTA